MKKLLKKVKGFFTNTSQNGHHNVKPPIGEPNVHLKTIKIDDLDNQTYRYEQDIRKLTEEIESSFETLAQTPTDQVKDHIVNLCEATEGKIKRGLNQQKFNVDNTKSFYQAKLKHLDSDVSRDIDSKTVLLDQAAKQAAEEEANIELTPLLNAYDFATKSVKQKEQQMEELVEEEYDNKPPLKKNILSRTFLYTFVVAFLGFADSMFNYTALQALSESLTNGMVLLLSAILGACIAASAHFVGASIKSKNPLELRAILIIAASLFGVIVLLRTNGGGALELTILNASIFALAGFASYLRHRDLTYWTLRESLIEWRDKAALLYVEIAKGKNRYKAGKDLSKISSGKDYKTKLEDKKFSLEEGILACEKWLAGLNALYLGYKDRIDVIKKAALNQCGKKAVHHQNGKSFFDDYPVHSKQTNSPGWQTPLFGLVFLFFMSACSAPPTTEGLVLVDKTIIHEGYNAPQGMDVYPLFSDIESGHIKFVPIIDQHIQPHWQVSLETSSYFSRVESEADSAHIKLQSDFNDAYHALPAPSPYYQKTLLFSVIERHLVPFSFSKADRKRVVIISDLMENSETFNFYRFRNNPASIMENFDLILAKMDNQFIQQRSMDLTGVEIVIVHSPQRSNDGLFYYVSQWWQRYFTGKGAKVSVVASLSGGAIILAKH